MSAVWAYESTEKWHKLVASRCHVCGKPATCFGQYEDGPVGYGCDECCGHGGETGWCNPLEEAESEQEAG